MNELIKIQQSAIGDSLVQTVNARDLHSFLEARKDFSTWIKDRIGKYGFTENQDFIIFPNLGENPSGMSGRPSIDYHLSLDMAKELSMVERNEKGKQARQYFLECERRANAIAPQFSLPATFAEALRLLACEVEMKELALAQRDNAIRTKAEIGCRREATAMATASAAMRQVGKLKDELGSGANWKTARAITWIKKYFALSQGMWMSVGKRLTALSDELGYEVRRVESEKYGQVNCYHVNVIERLKTKIEADDKMLGKYRAA